MPTTGSTEPSSTARQAFLLRLTDVLRGAGSTQEILQQVLENAKGGDTKAAELILSRVWPPRKGRRVSLSLPKVETGQDVVAAIGAVLEATGSGEITPDEAALVASLLETKRKAIETVELEARLTKLEEARETQ